jgi:glycosyl transferase family 2
MSRWLRRVCSEAARLGLGPRPADRPNGITAMVRVRGEEPWIEPSIRSVEAFANEILVLDNGAGPSTRRRLDALADTLGSRLRVERCPELDLFDLSDRGLARARFRWIIRWDADLVAHTSGPGDIRRLREHLLGVDRSRYELWHVPAVEVAGDLRHQLPAMGFRNDGQVVVWSRALRYVKNTRTLPGGALEPHARVLRPDRPVRQTLEALRTPIYYRVRRWPRPAYFHVNVKSARHMLLRHFWLDWVDAVAGGSRLTQEAYVVRRVAEEWGIHDLAEAERRYVERYCALLVPFDAAACGPYPDLLRPHVDAARYRLEYRDGVVTGRREPGDGSST